MALVAVGGYGRGELAPHSDLDVVLVHEDGIDPGELATALWYPLWDSGWRLDHSVRSMSQMLEVAADLRVALGLLDARHLAGDPGLTMRLRTTMLADWRRQARTRLPELQALTLKRHDVMGEVAHASVPDLKEAEGGLRDAGVLKAIEASWLVDASTPALEAARMTLLDVRDELHAITGRASDRVAPEMWGPLAERLGLADAEAAQRHVRSLGRRISHLTRLAWRRTDAVMATPSSERERRTPALRRWPPGSPCPAVRWCSTGAPVPTRTPPCCCAPLPRRPAATSSSRRPPRPASCARAQTSPCRGRLRHATPSCDCSPAGRA